MGKNRGGSRTPSDKRSRNKQDKPDEQDPTGNKPDTDETELDEDELEELEEIETAEEERSVKFYARKTAFDGVQRIRPGQTTYVKVKVRVDVDSGEIVEILNQPKWAATEQEWKELQDAEREEGAQRQRKPIRGGVAGVQL